jgi:class 3 adenylate cyclase
MPVVFGREVDGQFLGIAVSWHYGSAIGAVLAWVGLTLGIAQRLEGLSEGQRLPKRGDSIASQQLRDLLHLHAGKHC